MNSSSDDKLCSIVIVNFNGKHLLRDCLASVLSQSYSPFEVLLVDNGSTDGSADFVRSEFRDVRVIESPENLGFAGGNNLGVQQSKGDLVVLLNNDTVVQEGWLTHLVEAVLPHDTAVAASLVLTEAIPERYYERNGSINFLGHNIMRVFAKPENIFYAGGASLIYKKKVLGIPFNDDYFAYGEDVYLGLRARFKGYRIVHTNASIVKHLGGATAGRQRSRRITMLQERNRVLNIILWFSPSVLVRVAPLLCMNMVAKVITSFISARYSVAGILGAYAWLLGHPLRILKMRGVLRSEHIVAEKEVISWMTARLTNGESAVARLIDDLSILYCKVVGLKTIESLPLGSR